MKRSSYYWGVIALLLLLAFETKAHADLIPWTYTWSSSPGNVLADAPGTGYVSLNNESAHHAVGDSNIVATNLQTFSTATPNIPDIFTAKPYTLTLTLKDDTSGTSGTMTFTGVINGKLTAHSSTLGTTFTGMTTQQLVLGNSMFTTTIGPYTPPGPPDSSNFGSIGANAIVKVSTIVPSVLTLPEPGSMALSLFGVVLVGAGRRWLPGRKRRAVQ